MKRGQTNMNASAIISDTMTLEEKLAAIDAAMAQMQQVADDQARAQGLAPTMIDPQDALMCEGCQ